MKISDLRRRFLTLVLDVISRATCFVIGHQWHFTVVFADGSRKKACAFCSATKKIPMLKRLERAKK